MTRNNLNPIKTDDQPTSHVRVGASKVGADADLVEVIHNDRSAYFRVETEDDQIVSNIGNKAYINANVEHLFGGIDFSGGDKFVVDGSASLASIPAADSATIHPKTVAPDVLEEYLRSEEYLLHRIEEVAEVRGSLVRFTVTEAEPGAYSTLRVTEDTDLEFVDEPAEPPRQPAGTGQRGGPGGGSGRRGGGAGGGPGAGGPGGRGAPGGEGRPDDGATVSIEPTVPNVSFEEDVAGLESVKETARMLLALFDTDVRERIVEMYGDEFAERGGSMLLYGPPGCGKTHVSEAIAYEAKHETGIEDQYGEVVFLEIRGSDIQSKYAGEAEKNVSAVFNQAHRIAQEEGFAVLFFDEIETLIPDRSDDNLQRHERALTNAFLQEMNDVEDNLLVIGATNMPFTIDPAATRRFPIQQFIEQPDERVMAEVWRKQLASLPNTDSIDFERLGEASVGYTPAEVADRILGSDLQRELIRSVIDGEPQEVTTEYLLDRLEGTEPKTVRQYVSSVREQLDDLEGYPEMRDYVHEQADELGIDLQGGPGAPGGNALSSLLADQGDGAGDGGPDGGAGAGNGGADSRTGSGNGGTDGGTGSGESGSGAGEAAASGDGSAADGGPADRPGEEPIGDAGSIDRGDR
ncbi:ATP-binding protein [Halopenitus persicus]|uniref:Transitional endoplasmic reticulum ATPase n=1 Tax=Halopenitus persicus TaxID=1048396 RepID=A0A1H3MCX0_9EURY|nr:ATP-binding protein [Halopenitus persicus]QHS16530.1 ATP-binding protein [haloarchaeon 3A1-DGR]SDY74138.1 transitional endoplasmic reticulum ATPase [Halopenitus persicus]